MLWFFWEAYCRWRSPLSLQYKHFFAFLLLSFYLIFFFLFHSADENNERKPTALEHLMGKKPIYRRPTLRGFLSPDVEEEMAKEREKRHRSCPPGQSFRFKSIYRGKFRSNSERNADGGIDIRRISSTASGVSQALRSGGAKVARVVRTASQMARRLATRGAGNRADRKFTAPSSETLTHFDKVLLKIFLGSKNYYV